MADPISRVLGNQTSILVTVGDKTWQVSRCTKALQARYEAWLENLVRSNLFSQKGKLPPDDYQDALGLILESISLGKYGWGELAWKRSLESAAGINQLFRLLLEEHQPEVKQMKDEQLEELLGQNREGFQQAMRQALGEDLRPADPN